MKVNINKLPAGFSIRDGKVYQDGGTTGNQSDYGLVTYPQLDPFATGDAMSKVNYSINAVPRDEANLEAEKGETVLLILMMMGTLSYMKYKVKDITKVVHLYICLHNLLFILIHQQ